MRAAGGRGNGGEDFTAETRTTADVEDERGGVQGEEGEGAVCHFDLHGLNA